MKTRHIGMIIMAASGLALAACNSSNDGGIAGPVGPEPEPVPDEIIGQFGIVVGEPVAVISATRGDGASVDSDKFTVTFNNAEGTSITITTPEGEEITFNEDDPATWIGEDPDLRTGTNDPLAGLPLARLVSDRGDRLEIVIGEVEVPVAPDEPTNGAVVSAQPSAEPKLETEGRLAFAVARLDEHDTRDGFETYTVVGELTDVENLPRHAVDIFEDDDDGNPVLVHAAGTLIEGTAFYDGRFLATVFQAGQIVSDAVTGTADVDIDFAGNTVDITLAGSYVFDDFDDVEISDDNADELFVSLSGVGDGDDIDFNAGGTYTGDLAGTVDVPADFGFNIETVNVAGEFGGAVFGPGASAFDVLDTVDAEFLPSEDQIIAATGTAGVFEANSAGNFVDDAFVPDPSQDNADVEIVGAFGATGVDFCDAPCN